MLFGFAQLLRLICDFCLQMLNLLHPLDLLLLSDKLVLEFSVPCLFILTAYFSDGICILESIKQWIIIYGVSTDTLSVRFKDFISFGIFKGLLGLGLIY